ncbi:hypothetical protein [Haloferax sp. ATB1]|uniref:hypothetical protein n=1 Tax=Haloferax sp. ATB1 TaxID=1508454 RepID=UPI000A9A0128|nr:hypothetical protein [Haloferax sp. ATB1]
MPVGYPEYPGPQDAEEGKTYTYRTPEGDSVAATVVDKTVDENGTMSVALSYGGRN